MFQIYYGKGSATPGLLSTADKVLTEICDWMFLVTDSCVGRSRKRTDGTDTELTTEYSSVSGSGGQLSL